ncbi:MAG: ferritin-like domain-containing protein [Acidimicrobiales bacterium]
MTEHFQDQMEENASLLQRLSPSPLSRRRVLLGGGVAALGLVAAACGTDDDPFVLEDPPDPNLTQPTDNAPATGEGGGGGGEQGGGDVATAMTAAGLEVLAVNTYGAALTAAGEGKLGEVPPAVGEFATTAKAHHEAHRDAWNKLLTSLGKPAVTTPPSGLESTVNDMFAKVTDVPGVARLALLLEQIAADTYFAVIPTLSNAEAIKLAATIQPIDMQHAAILHYVLGEYPVPLTFATADNAFKG